MIKSLLLIASFTLGFPAFSKKTELLSIKNSLVKTEDRKPFSSVENRKFISSLRYIAGGLTSVFPGFGVGHAIQGRYSEAVFFMLAEGATVILAVKTEDEEELSKLLITFSALSFKLWEMGSAFKLPSHYKIVNQSPFQIKPLAFYDSDRSFHYGLSFKYKF